MEHTIMDISTGKLLTWSLTQILEEINRDRSDEWTPYDTSDWKEGWSEWCEGDIYTLVN